MHGVQYAVWGCKKSKVFYRNMINSKWKPPPKQTILDEGVQEFLTVEHWNVRIGGRAVVDRTSCYAWTVAIAVEMIFLKGIVGLYIWPIPRGWLGFWPREAVLQMMRMTVEMGMSVEFQCCRRMVFFWNSVCSLVFTCKHKWAWLTNKDNKEYQSKGPPCGRRTQNH